MLPRTKKDSSVGSTDVNVDPYGPDKCRICLKDGVISIFDQDNILSHVVEFGAITIKEHDSLPKCLCKDCNLLLEAAIIFRRTAQKTDELLRSVTAVDSKSIAYSKVYSWIGKRLNTDKVSNKDSCSELDGYNPYEESSFDFEYKDDDTDETDNLSSDSESSADIKNEREYLFIKNISEEEDDSDNTMATETIKSDTYMIIVEDEINKGNKKTDPFTCSNCDKSFVTMGELENHNELEHNIKVADKINCAVCGEVVSKSYYKIHMKLHREKYLEKKKSYSKVECKICNKKISKTYYKYHMKIHGSEDDRAERMRDCTLCQKSFSVNYYNDHMKRIHNLGPNGEKLHNVNINRRKGKHVQCPVCDKKIAEDSYKNHLAKHGRPPKKYVCEHCAREFIHPSAFKTHCLTHGGEFKHKCQFCPYRAQHVALLKVHVRTHTGDYNYKCTECPARFITKSNLNQHMQRHQGPGNIKCYDCDRTFYRKRNMEEHYKTMHLGIRDVICNICGKGFSHRDRMLSHQIKVHKRDKLLPRIPSYMKHNNQEGLTQQDKYEIE